MAAVSAGKFKAPSWRPPAVYDARVVYCLARKAYQTAEYWVNDAATGRVALPRDRIYNGQT